MATIATNDTKRKKPSATQVATFKSRVRELRARFEAGVLDPDITNDGLQRLMEMTRGSVNCNAQPEIPSWADQERPIIQHNACGMVDPSKLSTPSVFAEGEEVLEGKEYLARAQKLPGSANACAFDFYSKPENWKYLPKEDTGVNVIVFPQTVFRRSCGRHCVRCLYRDGAEWLRLYYWIGHGFSRRFQVAVLGK